MIELSIIIRWICWIFHHFDEKLKWQFYRLINNQIKYDLLYPKYLRFKQVSDRNSAEIPSYVFFLSLEKYKTTFTSSTGILSVQRYGYWQYQKYHMSNINSLDVQYPRAFKPNAKDWSAFTLKVFYFSSTSECSEFSENYSKN